MAKEKILKNYIYNTAYQVLLVLTPLITSPYLSRTLQETSVGVFNYAHSIVTYFMLFGTLGSSLYAQREIAYFQDDVKKRSKIFWEIIILRIFTVLISVGFFLGFILTVKEYKAVYYVLLFELVATAFDITWFFQGMEDFKKIVIRNTIFKIIGVISIFIFVKSPNDLYKYAACFTLPTLVGNLSLWIYLPKFLTKVKIQIKSILTYIKPMLALFLPQVAIEVYTVLDKTMLGAISTDIGNVAYYTYSQNIVKAILQLVTSLGVVMLPAMTNAFANNRHDEIKAMMQNSFKLIFILGCPMVFGLSACANNLAIWFYGESFAAVGPLMMVISPIILAIGLSTIIGKQYLLPTKKQSAFTISVVGGAAVNFAFNLLLIPKFNGIGASIATVIAEVVVVVIQIAFVRREIPILMFIKRDLKYLVYSFVMFAIIFPISFALDGILCTVIQVFAGVTVYGLLLILTKDKELIKLLSGLKAFVNRKRGL